MNANAAAYDEIFDALGDGTRRRTFELLKAGPQSVGALAEQLPVSRPAVSQHLRVLKDAGLVVDEQRGTRRLYRADPEALAALRVYVESFWTQVLESFKAAAEQEGDTRDDVRG
ncbi:MAG TPA: metalloregulator ArsR/SmtB family transcription factor [Actinomycetota bacterium]|nr:metalloregulator ArsR/SmtB family transcription factor [Actinomycetota bacterium]